MTTIKPLTRDDAHEWISNVDAEYILESMDWDHPLLDGPPVNGWATHIPGPDLTITLKYHRGRTSHVST